MEDGRQYEELHPEFVWKKDEHSNVLELALPGFKKEQFKVQLDNHGNLRITGEMSKGRDKWARFKTEFPIPENAKTNEIRAKFEKGKLYVTVPIRVTTKNGLNSDKSRKKTEKDDGGPSGPGGAKAVEEMGLRRPRKHALRAAVAALVVMGFGIYLAYKFWPKNGRIDHIDWDYGLP